MYARSTCLALSGAPRDAAARRPSWRPLFVCLLGYLLVLAAWSAPGRGTDDAPAQPEQSIKAAFLYKFLSYVEWRPGTFAHPASPIVIGVLGATDVAEQLTAIAAGRKAGERPIEVRSVRVTDALDGVHMLFVGRDQSAHVTALAPAARRRGVLLVTNYDGALDDGSAINLVVIDNRVRFEVSLDATEKSGLKLSSRMLSVALWVRPPS
jgi:hypothetical protein